MKIRNTYITIKNYYLYWKSYSCREVQGGGQSRFIVRWDYLKRELLIYFAVIRKSDITKKNLLIAWTVNYNNRMTNHLSFIFTI